VRFAKLHGAGNDFLLFDGRSEPDLAGKLRTAAPRLCHRRFGLGADGILVVTPTGASTARVDYWNSDGSEADFCANGTRCAASFIAAAWGWREMVLKTGYAAIPAVVEDGGGITLRLPAPDGVRPWQELAVPGGTARGRFLLVGVPHLIVRVDWPDFWQRSLAPLAPALRAHPELPAGGANVSFAFVTGPRKLAVRSWERGVEDETLSCGSGDVAAALVGLADGWVAAPVLVQTASNRVLTVEPLGVPPDCAIRFSGPAEWVAEGTLRPELLVGEPS
jgi:diaminopimelate epimerase